MASLQKLFAAYYLWLIKLRRNKIIRHMNRGGGEDFGALCLVICSQFFLIIFLLIVAQNIFDFRIDIKNHVIGIKISVLIIMLVSILWGYKYFISDRERRNRFIDGLRNEEKPKRIIWMIISILLMLIPIIVIFLSAT